MKHKQLIGITLVGLASMLLLAKMSNRIAIAETSIDLTTLRNTGASQLSDE